MQLNTRRLILKTVLLSVFANLGFLFIQSHERGRLIQHDYIAAGTSFLCTLVLIAGFAYILSKFARPVQPQKRPEIRVGPGK